MRSQRFSNKEGIICILFLGCFSLTRPTLTKMSHGQANADNNQSWSNSKSLSNAHFKAWLEWLLWSDECKKRRSSLDSFSYSNALSSVKGCQLKLFLPSYELTYPPPPLRQYFKLILHPLLVFKTNNFFLKTCWCEWKKYYSCSRGLLAEQISAESVYKHLLNRMASTLFLPQFTMASPGFWVKFTASTIICSV